MSCWRKQTVLRLPAKTLGIWFEWQWEQFTEEYEELFSWDEGWFAPSLCSSEYGHFLDYVLEDTFPVDHTDSDYPYLVRKLSRQERQKYLPVFQQLFPQFGKKEMKTVHYCSYVWYDGTDAPPLY